MKKQYLIFSHAPKFVSRRFMGAARKGYAAYKTDGGDDDAEDDSADGDGEKKSLKTSADLLKELGLLKANLEKKAKEDAKKEAKAEVELQLKAIKEQIEALTKASEVTEMKSLLDQTVEAVEGIAAKVKATPLPSTNETKSFNQVIAEVIQENADKIAGFKKGAAEQRFELKTVGDMSAAANFPAYGSFTQDVRNIVIPKPYERTWLGDLLPAGTSKGSSILYPKENGGEGGAAAWTDPTQDKAQMDFDLTSQSAYFKWLAGYVIIDRESLDDIDFITSYIQQKMLISLKIAENSFILNGTSDTNPVTGMLDAAAAYDGAYLTPVERVIDAAYGQIPENTFDFYNATTTVMRPRDAVAIGLNKAAGSGEFDLPNGSVAFANGKLALGALDVVTTTGLAAGKFLTFDKAATMFIKRMQPELRMFEDSTLAKKNKVMFRVEERVTLAIFNNDALVYGDLS